MTKTLVGRVVSTKMQKTVVIEVETLRSHPLYKKPVKKTKKYKAHAENMEFKEGDKVKITHTRPISKDKKWKVIEKLG